MFLNILNIIKDMMFFTGSYSNNVFPDPLSEEEEKIMIERMLNKDPEARNKLIEHNLRLVAHIVKKFENKKNGAFFKCRRAGQIKILHKMI